MWKFLGRVLTTVLGVFIAFFLFFFLIVFFAKSAKEPTAIVPVNSVLKINIDKTIFERASDNPFADFMPFSSSPDALGLIELRKAIKKAKTDNNIKGIYLEMNMANAGYGTLQELRSDLIDFKTSGKFIYAYGEFFTEGAYYLLSAADKIFLNPSGLIEFNGLSYNVTFFKGTLDKLEIKPEIFKVGEYKSAVEPFLFDKMSDPSKEQAISFIGAIHDEYLKAVSLSRKIPVERLKVISDSMLVKSPKDAVKLGLITQTAYKDQVLTELTKESKTNDKLNLVSIQKYLIGTEEEDKNESGDKIAVIIASGDINSGKGEENESIGSEKISEQLRLAREDNNVKAVVLRVNSPGGSALASDVMWREVVLTKEKKPVIASMSDLAASGGYFISMACDKIVAQPMTITGSIGVFGILFNAKNFLKNKLGITNDGVQTGKFSDIGNPSRDFTPFERKLIQKEIDSTYEDFVSKAAKGRNMSLENLKKLASGRVWTGTQAKENGLIDELGGLETAIKLAAQKAKIKNYNVVYLPKKKDFFEDIVTKIGESDTEAKVKVVKTELGELYPYFTYLQKIKKMEGVQARVPFEIVIK